jgi:hypothetical protein
MLKILGTTRCRRCGSALEHTTDQPDAPIGSLWSRDSKLVCRLCGFNRPVIYAHVRSMTRVA